MEIQTSIQIQATTEKVWQILTTFENYNLWNPFILSLKGEVAVGNNIKVHIQPPNTRAMHFTPKVLCFTHQVELKWLGHFLVQGLFDGEHRFKLTENNDGSTTFEHSEKFNGILVPLFAKMLNNNTKEGFHLMNKALKARAEQLK